MKTKRELERKEKKIREAICQEEKEERKIEFKRRSIFLIIFLIILGLFFFILQANYNSFNVYDDTEARESYARVLQNFENLSSYHLKYKTSLIRGSVIKDVYYIKDRLLLIRNNQGKKEVTSIYLPGMNETILIKNKNYEGECLTFCNDSIAEKNLPCAFNLSFEPNSESIPINIDLASDQLVPQTGKVFLTERELSGEKIFCFDTKIDRPLFDKTFLYSLEKYVPFVISFLQKLPHETTLSSHLCFTEQGVLVQTSKYERFIQIEYSSDNSFLSSIPLYSDFQKFLNKSLTGKENYYKITIDSLATYFSDYDNYAVFGSFDGKEYFTSGCVNGTDLIYNKSCNMKLLPPQVWVNYSFFPLNYVQSKTIANFSTDCFEYPSYSSEGLRNEFCIIDGGYVVSKYSITKNSSREGYEAINISLISQKEFDKQMAKAVYLSPIK